MSVEKKRLFVGGLNSGTTEQDVRERFKKFGSIESVELHKVQKKEGFPEKTFAYVNIESPDTNIKRCISLLSNTKWKGGVLKIELAKESFLSRLKKEREQLASDISKTTTSHSCIPSLPKELQSPVKNAVPGTLIEGQKNWIVGKFGRALPVVHMRPKHGKKIFKFDPSKTVHNLKRFKEDEEEGAQVSELTWNLGPQRKYPWDGNTSSGNRYHQSSSDSSDDDADGKFYDEENTKRKFVKKAKKSAKMTKTVNDDTWSDSESDSDSNAPKTAKKKSKTVKPNQNDIQQENGTFIYSSCSDREKNDGSEKQKAKKKNVANPETGQTQDQCYRNSSNAHGSSADEEESHKTPKKKNKKTEKRPEIDASVIDNCEKESSLKGTTDDFVKQTLEQSIQFDGKMKKKLKNMDIESLNSEKINLKPKKKRKHVIDEETNLRNSVDSDGNDLDSNSQNDQSAKPKQKRKHTVSRNEDLINSYMTNINSNSENISNLESTVTKPKKKRKSKTSEETGLSNHSSLNIESDMDNVENIISQDVENGIDPKPKQTKKKQSAEEQKNSSESSEMEIAVLSDGSSTKANKKEKTKERKNKNKQELSPSNNVEEGFSVIQNKFDNNNIEKTKKNSKKQQEHLVGDQDDENGCKQVSKKKRIVDITTKELKEENVQTKEKSTKYPGNVDEEGCSDEVLSDNSQDDIYNNNHTCRKSKQMISSADVTTCNTPITGASRENKNKTLTKNNNKTSASSRSGKTSTKKLTSNEKRLKAIKEKEVNTNTMQSIVSSALQNLDKTDQPDNTRHITFDDDGDDVTDKASKEEEGKHTNKDPKQISGKISGSKAKNWLGLDSDSDEDLPTFDAKPQFEGKTGQKLFELQKSYRGDSRFQLDKRFAESDDEDGEETANASNQNNTNDDDVDTDDDDGDKVTKQLSQEKDIAMSVLRGILGQNFGTKHESSSRKKKFKDSNLLRYDPTRDDHEQFEQAPKKDNSLEPAIKETQPTSADVIPSSSVPEIDDDKYYDVNTEVLTEMFSNKNKEGGPTSFSFLSNQDEDDDNPSEVEWGKAEILKSKPVVPVMLPYDSSGDEENDYLTVDEPQQTNKHSLPDERFFFHFGEPDMESKVFDQENVFKRTETIEQLNQHWVNVRSELTQDYKKKHKDALRRQSKIAAKRARMR